MTLNEYCNYICNPLAEAKARLLVVSPGETWTSLRQFYQKRGCYVLRLSDLVTERAWLPMPDEVFNRVHDALSKQALNAKCVVILGLPGYLALLTDEHKRSAITALRELIDSTMSCELVCLLRMDANMRILLREIFSNPRYRQGKQLIEIDGEKGENDSNRSVHAEVTLVGDDLAAFIPECCETFPKYLRHTEEHPFDNEIRRIVVASEGRELAGLSAEVRQVVTLRDFARIFYSVDDATLSDKTLLWMCERGKECAGKPLQEKLKTLFFPEGGVEKYILRVFDRHTSDVERSAILWLVKRVASNDSYLVCIAEQKNITVENFRSSYVTGAVDWLDHVAGQTSERKVAIKEADVIMSEAAIRKFITLCMNETTSRVAPWLNCGTAAEGAELLRRCKVDGIVSNAIKEVYPEARAYLNPESVFDAPELENYFREYRELKMTCRVTPGFFEKAKKILLPSSLQSRDAMLQRYASDDKCALLVVDAMGAEWLPMLLSLARERNLCIESFAIALAQLPTMTEFNNICWGDAARRLPDCKRFDNLAHCGEEQHESRRPEENLYAALDVIGTILVPRVSDGLASFERVVVTADHGSSRLAALAWQVEPRLSKTLACEDGAEVADWRYRDRAKQGSCPEGLEETLDGKYWVMRGYDRLPKKGGGQGFEFHGGATLEERLVPVVVFTQTGLFVPKIKTNAMRPQITENDDFDL